MANTKVTYSYYLLNIIFVSLYILYFLGIGDTTYYKLDFLNELYKIFIGFVLLYFFSPWHKEKLDNIHKKIAFSAGLLLIFTSSLTVIIENLPIIRKIPFINKIRTVQKIFT